MINLRKNSGLDIGLDLEKSELCFGAPIAKVKADIRTLPQMRDVLLNKGADEPSEFYYMYRGISKIGDQSKIEARHLRYDITVIKPGLVNGEFVKTFGHYHTNGYPELYEVLWGEALCLLQRPDERDRNVIEDVILVKAGAKEKIVVLPRYGHILINPSVDTPLVMANWVCSDFESDYAWYKKAQGGAYFITDNDGEYKFSENKFFSMVSPLKLMRPDPKAGELGLNINTPIYNLWEDKDKLTFLVHPDKYHYESCFIAERKGLGAIPV